jgi:hypothetical protein
MDYSKHYNLLIERAKKRPIEIEKYYENHHIIPKCLQGTDDDGNLVKLTAREHFFAHLLLTKIYPEKKKLHIAFWFMCNQRGRGGQKNRTVPSARQYSAAREAYIKAMKENMITKENPAQSLRMKQNNPNYKPGVKEKQSAAKKGKLRSEEFKNKLKEKLKGRVVTWGDKVSKTRLERGLGREPKSESHKAKISEALKGIPKPEYTCPHCGKTGKGASNMQRWHFENCKVITQHGQKNTGNS